MTWVNQGVGLNIAALIWRDAVIDVVLSNAIQGRKISVTAMHLAQH